MTSPGQSKRARDLEVGDIFVYRSRRVRVIEPPRQGKFAFWDVKVELVDPWIEDAHLDFKDTVEVEAT